MQFLLFSTIFCCLLVYLCVITGTRFSLRDKRLFEISEFEITRVDCNAKTNAEYDTTVAQTKNNFNRGFAFERSVGNILGVGELGGGGGVGGAESSFTRVKPHP